MIYKGIMSVHFFVLFLFSELSIIRKNSAKQAILLLCYALFYMRAYEYDYFNFSKIKADNSSASSGLSATHCFAASRP